MALRVGVVVCLRRHVYAGDLASTSFYDIDGPAYFGVGGCVIFALLSHGRAYHCAVLCVCKVSKSFQCFFFFLFYRGFYQVDSWF